MSDSIMTSLKPKDTSGVTAAIAPFVAFPGLSAAFLAPAPPPGPRARGTLSAIVLRPSVNSRKLVPSATLDVDAGVVGSGWSWTPEKLRTDQVCVMGTAVIRAVAASDDAALWAPAGDQFFFDFALDAQNLATGDCVAVGDEVVLAVTRKPHNGCRKFVARYGVDALKVMNGPEGKRRRLRGIYFCVVKGGVVKVGDVIVKIERPPGVSDNPE